MQKIIIFIMIFFSVSILAKDNRMLILDFDNNTGLKKYDFLERVIADMLRVDLSSVKGLKIIERDKLGNPKFVNNKRVLKLGKALSANWILKGSFSTFINKMVMNIHIIDVETAVVIEAISVNGKITEYFELERELTRKIIKSIQSKGNTSISLSNLTKEKYKRKELKDFKAILEYSKGIKLYDDGNLKEAQKAFKKAKEIDENFDYGDRYLKLIKVKLSKNQKEKK